MQESSPFFLGWMKTFEMSASDAREELAEGGVFDTIVLVTSCLACGEKKEASLRWFSEHSFRCGCGGKFDTTTLREFAATGAPSVGIRLAEDPKPERVAQDGPPGGN